RLAPPQASGPVSGGTQVVIAGVNFSPDAVVYFGDAPATDAQLVQSGAAGTITTTAPAHATAKVDVTVLVDDGSITVPQAYWYVLPIPDTGQSSGAGQSGVQPQAGGSAPAPAPT